MDDATLAIHVERAQDGDERSFTAIVAALGEMLLAIAYRYTGDWESSRDVAQETWLSVFRSLRRFDGRVPFRAWLIAVHRNKCIDHLRRRKRSIEMPIEDPERGETARTADPAPSPYEDYERKKRLDAVLAAAGRLPRKQRRVFALVDLEGIPCREAARILDMHEVTLRTNLYHARRSVARELRRSGVIVS
jgi:RNA polymerase sigma-70 factor (ECF subfamily)